MSHVELEITGHLATLTLNRPEKRNAIDPLMLDTLDDHLVTPRVKQRYSRSHSHRYRRKSVLCRGGYQSMGSVRCTWNVEAVDPEGAAYSAAIGKPATAGDCPPQWLRIWWRA